MHVANGNDAFLSARGRTATLGSVHPSVPRAACGGERENEQRRRAEESVSARAGPYVGSANRGSLVARAPAAV